MLLAAVSQELVPPLSAADHVHDIIAILIGFSLGVTLMIGLEFIVSDGDNEEGEEMKENILTAQQAILSEPGPAVGHPTFTRSASTRSITSASSGKKSKAFTSIRLNERNGNASSKIILPAFPVAFAAAVYIDSAMDGVAFPPFPIPLPCELRPCRTILFDDRAPSGFAAGAGLLIGLALVTGKRCFHPPAPLPRPFRRGTSPGTRGPAPPAGQPATRGLARPCGAEHSSSARRSSG